MNKTMLLWADTSDAPPEICFDRDDVDFIVAIPPDMEIPWRLRQLSGNDQDAKVWRIRADGSVEREQWTHSEKDSPWGATELTVPLTSPYIGYIILIATHA